MNITWSCVIDKLGFGVGMWDGFDWWVTRYGLRLKQMKSLD